MRADWEPEERQPEAKKFCLPSPSSDFLADIIGLQKKQTNEDLSRTMKGSLLCASSKASIHLQNDPIIQNYGSKKVCLMQSMLTKEEMKVFHFPLQGFPECKNFVPTKYNGSLTDKSPLFALDCEMVAVLWMNSLNLTKIFWTTLPALTGVTQLVDCHPTNQKKRECNSS